jgi:hypothetical protein
MLIMHSYLFIFGLAGRCNLVNKQEHAMQLILRFSVMLLFCLFVLVKHLFGKEVACGFSLLVVLNIILRTEYLYLEET